MPALVEVLGMRWASDAEVLRQRLGIQLQETQLAEKITVFETVELFRSFYRQGPIARARHRAGAARGEARSARRDALGRAEAAARAGLRARRRSGVAVSRRADDRPRSAGAPPVVGSHRRLPEGGPDDSPHDPLHGRGGDPVRSRRHHGSRQGDRLRHAARAGGLDWRRARGRVLDRQRTGSGDVFGRGLVFAT